MPTLKPSVKQKSKVLSRPTKPHSPSPGSDYNLHRNITLGKDWCFPLRLWLPKTQDPTFLVAWNFLRWWLPAATRTFHLEKTNALIPTCDKPLDLVNNSEEDNHPPSSKLLYGSSYAPSSLGATFHGNSAGIFADPSRADELEWQCYWKISSANICIFIQSSGWQTLSIGQMQL